MPEAHKNTPAGHVGMPYHGIEAFISLSVRRNVYSRGGYRMQRCLSVTSDAVNLNTFLFCFLYYLS